MTTLTSTRVVADTRTVITKRLQWCSQSKVFHASPNSSTFLLNVARSTRFMPEFVPESLCNKRIVSGKASLPFTSIDGAALVVAVISASIINSFFDVALFPLEVALSTHKRFHINNFVRLWFLLYSSTLESYIILLTFC